MAVNLERFNRIIDLSFITAGNKYDSRGFLLNAGQKSIVCPRYGIKPNIEINGTYGESQTLYALHVSVKNLYLDLRTEQYSKLKIRAGYANNLITIESEIFKMYQESPGPEGTTIIECKLGSITQNWLDSMVQLNFKPGAKLSDILRALGTKLKASDVNMGKQAKSKTLQEMFLYDGSARGAMAKLEEVFQKDKLKVFMRGSRLCAICLETGDFIEQHVLQYMSAPPQHNPGDKDGNWTTQITAPWMPEVQPGDQIIIPSQVYQYNFELVGGAKKTQKMIVTQMSFHFGTRGSVNQMTCQGYINRE
jgi:hypothetical protein